MTSHALRPLPRRLRSHPPGGARRRRRLAVDNRLLSVAGLVGARVYAEGAHLVGLLDDLVVHVGEERYPSLVGAVVRTPRGRMYVADASILEVLPHRVLLAGQIVRSPVERGPGLITLVHDVLDRQIVDVDGANVDRVSDLILGRRGDDLCLVGVDVSIRTLLRRLGPAALRRRVASGRVYDWASVAAFSERETANAASILHLTEAAAALRERGAADLDRLLGDLPAHERAQLAGHLAGAP